MMIRCEYNYDELPPCAPADYRLDFGDWKFHLCARCMGIFLEFLLHANSEMAVELPIELL